MLYLRVLLLIIGLSYVFGLKNLHEFTVPNNTHLVLQENGIRGYAPDGAKYLFVVPESPRMKRDSGSIASVSAEDPAGNWRGITATWTVPSFPEGEFPATSSDIVYFYNSLQDAEGNNKLQATLQYSYAGWNFGATFKFNGASVSATKTQVFPGDEISGIIYRTDSAWNIECYVAGGLANSLSLDASAISAPTTLFAMEAYGISSCNQYPPDNVIDAYHMSFTGDAGPVTPTWSSYISSNSQCSPGATAASDSAEISWHSS